MLKTLLTKTQGLCVVLTLITLPSVTNADTVSAVSDAIHRSGKTTPAVHSKASVKLSVTDMRFVKKYCKTSGACLRGVKRRSALPFTIIDSIFHRYHLPVELKYLAVIESELKPSALSHVGARGPWQLMPATAEALGLKINRQCDERTNYYKSTIAAAHYLRDLHATFHDWLLVLAAYNGGPRPVYAAIRESGSRNFWILQKYLPAESRDHVKKFIATHYYFEGMGNETLLAKAGSLEYKRGMNTFAKFKAAGGIRSKNVGGASLENTWVAYPVSASVVNADPFGLDRFATDDLAMAEQPESTEQKFQRLMAASAECLKKSMKGM